MESIIEIFPGRAYVVKSIQMFVDTSIIRNECSTCIRHEIADIVTLKHQLRYMQVVSMGAL